MHLPLFGKPGVTWLQVGGGGMGLWPIAGGEGRWLQARGAGPGGCKAGRGEEDNMWLDGRAWPGQTGLVASRVFFEYMYWDLCQVVCWVIEGKTFGLVSELGAGGWGASCGIVCGSHLQRTSVSATSSFTCCQRPRPFNQSWQNCIPLLSPICK